MYGAIIGDIIGSKFEFDRGPKSKDFVLFTTRNSFTDDTVMTVAVADALLKAGKEEEVLFKKTLIESMKRWGRRYPHAGYGGRFIYWVLGDDIKPYGSYGNGSAMRVSPVGWFYDTIEKTREVARWTAEVTHNHPEGVKGAEATAAVIFLARNGEEKKTIAEYIRKEFGYKLNRTLEEIARDYHHVEDCMHTVPEAITCFLEGEGYEDTIRNVMYIGGDTDTLGAIAGAMAEAFWAVPLDIMEKGRAYLPEDLQNVVEEFYVTIAPIENNTDELGKNNRELKEIINRALDLRNDEGLHAVLHILLNKVILQDDALAAMRDVNNVMRRRFNPMDAVVGAKFTLGEEVRLRFQYVMNDKEEQWIPMFTDKEETRKGTADITINMPIETFLREGLNYDGVKGVVINPYGRAFAMDKDLLRFFLKVVDETRADAGIKTPEDIQKVDWEGDGETDVVMPPN